MKQIRIGVIGCASIAKRHVIPAICSLKDEFKLVAIASRTKEKADNFADTFQAESITGYENLLDRCDIDAVYIPLPTGLHGEWITKALDAGKHIIAEKSLVTDIDSAHGIVELAKSKKLLVIENFMYRYHSQHQYIWSKLNTKYIGDIRLFRSQFGFPPLDKSNFRYDKRLGGGSLLDAAAYTVNASLWFLGKDQEVTTSTLYLDNNKVDMFGNASLINHEGIVSQLSFGFDNYYQCNYEFWGSAGKVVVPKAFTPKPTEITNIQFEKNGEMEKIEFKGDNHFINLLSDFYRSILLNRYDCHYSEILAQSRILSQIRNKAIKINL